MKFGTPALVKQILSGKPNLSLSTELLLQQAVTAAPEVLAELITAGVDLSTQLPLSVFALYFSTFTGTARHDKYYTESPVSILYHVRALSHQMNLLLFC